MTPTHLPIQLILPDLRRCLGAASAVVLHAPPGAGKTTGVPPALLAEPWLAGRSILMLEPRRLAARAAAQRIAALLGEPVGRTVGYRVRLESRVSSATRIEVVTEGILTRRLQGDPALEGVGLVIFDEFHERSLHADLALALCLDAQRALREDLKILVMSATLDTAAVAALLGGAPVVRSAGRSFPVEVHYLARDPHGDIAQTLAAGARRALREQSGDILAFLPGGREIRRARALLEEEVGGAGVALHALYGDLPRAAQELALQPDPQGRRKLVLATSIAETSLTIEGVRVVVDSGWSRNARFDPGSALTRLVTVRASRDAVEQRAGRAGRLGPGVCYRLWSEAAQHTLPERTTPEILAADLAPLALELALWGVSDPAQLAWLDSPPAGALAQARALLTELGALDPAGLITPVGKAMAALPVHPRLAHMLHEGRRLGLGGLACDLAALIVERDILTGERGADVHERLEALDAYRRAGRAGASRHGADPGACAAVEQASVHWRRLLGVHPTPDPDAAGLLLAFAYPDRVAARRGSDGERYLLAGGCGARLHRGDRLARHGYLVAAHLDAGTAEGVIHLAAPVALDSLRAHLAERIAVDDAVYWDPQQQAVVARREERLGELVLASVPHGAAPASADPRVRAAMVEGVRRMGLASLPWTDAAREWQARVLSLRHWLAEEDWPDVSVGCLAATLEEWLAPHLEGITRAEHLKRLDLAAILQGRLDWRQRTRLEEAAPTHVQVPSGSRLRLQYRPGEAPVLAVKLQEMFGAADGPRVACGRVAVTLHLLSPARRPIQVTQDLRGFWERTYAEVKKELKGRYPKHPWPDDPWAAVPTARTKRAER
jgi:ATP-dependent helicase HrpB